MITASIVADSVGPAGQRLTTFVLRYPKFIHGEFMTHRMFSRNASSSRAIPVSKNLEEVRTDELRAAPVWWGAEQRGMSATTELSSEELQLYEFVEMPIASGHLVKAKTPLEWSKLLWKHQALRAANTAEEMQRAGVHKSIVNRILEPFLHINVVATSCSPGLMNFFGLRLDKGAQPEIRVLAEKMWAEYQRSEPRNLKPGEWHLPFIEPSDLDNFDTEICLGNYDDVFDGLRRISVARCARVSYLSFDTGKRSTIEEDMALYDRLVGSQPLHASPAEHQATPDKLVGVGACYWERLDLHDNLPGWLQYRKILPDEDIAPLPEGYQI